MTARFSPRGRRSTFLDGARRALLRTKWSRYPESGWRSTWLKSQGTTQLTRLPICALCLVTCDLRSSALRPIEQPYFPAVDPLVPAGGDTPLHLDLAHQAHRSIEDVTALVAHFNRWKLGEGVGRNGNARLLGQRLSEPHERSFVVGRRRRQRRRVLGYRFHAHAKHPRDQIAAEQTELLNLDFRNVA